MSQAWEMSHFRRPTQNIVEIKRNGPVLRNKIEAS